MKQVWVVLFLVSRHTIDIFWCFVIFTVGGNVWKAFVTKSATYAMSLLRDLRNWNLAAGNCATPIVWQGDGGVACWLNSLAFQNQPMIDVLQIVWKNPGRYDLRSETQSEKLTSPNC